MSELTATEKRTAATHLASIWSDGKRRVVVARRVAFRHGHQTITKDPTEVIEDPHTIALLDEHGIEYIELEVNGRPKRGRGLIDAEIDREKNVEAVAQALGIPAAVLHDAIERGDHERLQTLKDAARDASIVALREWLAASGFTALGFNEAGEPTPFRLADLIAAEADAQKAVDGTPPTKTDAATDNDGDAPSDRELIGD